MSGGVRRRLVAAAAAAAMGGVVAAAWGLWPAQVPVETTAKPASAAAATAPTATPQHEARRRAAADAARVLTRWDKARAAAYASGDRAALAALYPRRSAVGSADLALFDRYRAAGVRVRGLRMQLLSVEVLAARDDRLRVLVTDRVHAARAVAADGGVRRLPADEPSTRLVVLRGAAAAPTGWVVSAVRPRSAR